MLYGQKHYEVAKYLILTGHVENVTNLVMGNKTFKKLPDDIQSALVASGDEAGQFLTNLVLKQEQETIEKMKKEGVTVVEVDRSLFKTRCSLSTVSSLSGHRVCTKKRRKSSISNKPVTGPRAVRTADRGLFITYSTHHNAAGSLGVMRGILCSGC